MSGPTEIFKRTEVYGTTRYLRLTDGSRLPQFDRLATGNWRSESDHNATMRKGVKFARAIRWRGNSETDPYRNPELRTHNVNLIDNVIDVDGTNSSYSRVEFQSHDEALAVFTAMVGSANVDLRTL